MPWFRKCALLGGVRLRPCGVSSVRRHIVRMLGGSVYYNLVFVCLEIRYVEDYSRGPVEARDAPFPRGRISCKVQKCWCGRGLRSIGLRNAVQLPL